MSGRGSCSVRIDLAPLRAACAAIDAACGDGRIAATEYRRLVQRLSVTKPHQDPGDLLTEVVIEPARGGGFRFSAGPGRDMLDLLARAAPIAPRRWPAGPWG